MTLASPPRIATNIRRVAIVFSGGPAPGANAVISSAAISFLNNDIEVVGLLHGYSNVLHFGEGSPLVEGRDYIRIDRPLLKRTRNSQGILIGTARANPGKAVGKPAHYGDPEKTAGLRAVHAALCSIGVDALVSIGGDDTLRTANKFQQFQKFLPTTSKRIPVVHLPKTIDNDYNGIDFTFGYFTAVETLATEIRNLNYDAEAGRAYFLCETMGRSAGWLAYGAAIAGDACLVISVEDIAGKYLAHEEVIDPETAEKKSRAVMNVDEVVKRIVRTMRAREEQEGREHGVICVSEGLAEFLPSTYIQGVERDDFGHLAVSKLNLSRIFSTLVSTEYQRQTGKKRKVTGLQLGYESRCAIPHAFDVMLGSQLGVGAYRALIEKGLDGVMVSVSGQLDLNFVPFAQLVDPETLVTVVRYIKPGCDFHQLARFLETAVND